MKIKHWGVWALAGMLLVVPACKPKEAGVDKKSGVLVEVNGTFITNDDLYLRTGGEHGGNVTPEMQNRVLEDLIDQELLYQQGKQQGLDKDAKYQNAVNIMEARLKEFKRAEMARRVMSTKIAATVNITNADVDRYVEAHADRLRTEYRLGVIRFKNEPEAREAFARIQGGEAFERVAGLQQSHASGQAKAPWDLGFARWVQIPGEWRDAADRLAKGAVSDVVYSQRTGYSILKLIDKRKDPKLDLKTMNATVMNRLRDEKIREAYEQYLKKLRSEATIKRFAERRE